MLLLELRSMRLTHLFKVLLLIASLQIHVSLIFLIFWLGVSFVKVALGDVLSKILNGSIMIDILHWSHCLMNWFTWLCWFIYFILLIILVLSLLLFWIIFMFFKVEKLWIIDWLILTHHLWRFNVFMYLIFLLISWLMSSLWV